MMPYTWSTRHLSFLSAVTGSTQAEPGPHRRTAGLLAPQSPVADFSQARTYDQAFGLFQWAVRAAG